MNLFCVVVVLCLAGISGIQGASIAQNAPGLNLYERQIAYLQKSLEDLNETYMPKWQDVDFTLDFIDASFIGKFRTDCKEAILNEVKEAAKQHKDICEPVRLDLVKKFDEIYKNRSNCIAGYAGYKEDLESKLMNFTKTQNSISDSLSKIIAECTKEFTSDVYELESCVRCKRDVQQKSLRELENFSKSTDRQVDTRTKEIYETLTKCYSDLIKEAKQINVPEQCKIPNF